MFQNFPYTDMHQLNLDWIIKIAKDFLDQYTHIQELIETGIQNIQNTTETGVNELTELYNTEIAGLNSKYTELNNLLQAWYDTHSLDIATQLATSLAELTTATNDAITTFNARAAAKGAEVIASIPDDYTALGNQVQYLIDGLRNWNLTAGLRNGVGFVSSSTGELVQAGGSYGFSNYIKVNPGELYEYEANVSGSVLALAAYENDYDTTAVIAKSIIGTNSTKGIYTVPDGINYVRISSNPWYYAKLVKIPSVDTITAEVQQIIRAGKFGMFIEPEETEKYKMYNHVTGDYTTITRAQCQKYMVDNDAVGYVVKTSLYAGSQGYGAVTFFDSNDNVIYVYKETTAGVTNIEVDNEIINIPPNASYFFVNARDVIPCVRKISSDSSKFDKDVSILFIGNSLLQDGVSYLPCLLKQKFPNINFKFYLWYIGGATLHEQYHAFTDNTPADIFSIAVNTESWTNLNGVTMIDILEQKTFDIVCMQEYFNYKNTYGQSDLDDWNNCQKYIRVHYLGSNSLEFITYFHAPLRTRKEEVYDLTKIGCASILKNTIADDIIGCGMAIYNALDTAIGTLGDGGDMTTGDRTHAQEGIPCLVQDYTALLWLLDRLAMPRTVYHMSFKMTTAIYNTLNIPGPNLGSGVITGDNAQNDICITVAYKSYKESKQFLINNMW